MERVHLTPASAEVIEQYMWEVGESLWPPVGREESEVPPWVHDGLRYVEEERPNGTIVLVAYVNPARN